VPYPRRLGKVAALRN